MVGRSEGRGRVLYIEQSCYVLRMRPPISRAKIRTPSPVLAVVLLAILVMASAVLGWLGGLVAGVVILAVVLGIAFGGIAMVKRSSRERTVKKYEQRRLQQRNEFGTDVGQRARESD